uniref:Uncharacterized protein n=1 Tax=Bactrocera dorsalis TaxID=27457 RepID=A0A034WSH6_BACDO
MYRRSHQQKQQQQETLPQLAVLLQPLQLQVPPHQQRVPQPHQQQLLGTQPQQQRAAVQVLQKQLKKGELLEEKEELLDEEGLHEEDVPHEDLLSGEEQDAQMAVEAVDVWSGDVESSKAKYVI